MNTVLEAAPPTKVPAQHSRRGSATLGAEAARELAIDQSNYRLKYVSVSLPSLQIVASIQSFQPCSWEVIPDAVCRWNHCSPTSSSQSRILGFKI
jgi:hypothetical protein